MCDHRFLFSLLMHSYEKSLSMSRQSDLIVTLSINGNKTVFKPCVLHKELYSLYKCSEFLNEIVPKRLVRIKNLLKLWENCLKTA